MKMLNNLFKEIAELLISVTSENKPEKFPPVLKEHWDYHPNVCSYAKFRARRIIQEKNRLQEKENLKSA